MHFVFCWPEDEHTHAGGRACASTELQTERGRAQPRRQPAHLRKQRTDTKRKRQLWVFFNARVRKVSESKYLERGYGAAGGAKPLSRAGNESARSLRATVTGRASQRPDFDVIYLFCFTSRTHCHNFHVQNLITN